MPGSLPKPATSGRIQSIDLVRGMVMVVMALDHVRDFLHSGAQRFSPQDLTQTTALLFFTRWATHFCAPAFMFLAGASAYLYGRRRRSSNDVSRFLWTRGLWLIIVELTLINVAESFNVRYEFLVLQVMWALGWSMIALSALRRLPWRVLLVFSVIMIVVHNAFDGIDPATFGSFSWLWTVLHVGPMPLTLTEGHTILVIYPLVPWIGVMSAGYCFGRVFDLDAQSRRRALLQLGLALTAAFVALRVTNIYGDPSPWRHQATTMLTFLDFLRASKYPPSLLYLLMTLGPIVLTLRLLDGVEVGARNPFIVFGRAPFFYYIVHWYTLHLVALAMAYFRYGHFNFLFGLPPSLLPFAVGYPPDYGWSLPVVYMVWAAIVVALYPLCLWFTGVKARSRSPWLSYL